MKTIFATILISSITILNSCRTIEVNKIEVNQDDQNERSIRKQGMIYALPKKEFQLLVTMEETYLEPSSLAKEDNYIQAIKDLKLEDEIITDKDSSYKIISIELLERSIPDPENIYFVSLLGDKAPFRKAEHSFNFDSGIFLSESASKTEDQTFQFVEKSTAALTKLFLAGLTPESALSPLAGNKNIFSELEYFDANKSIFEAAVKKKTVVENLMERLRFFQEKRDAILGGTINSSVYENNQTSLILDQLKNEEQRIFDLLQGKKTTKTTHHYIKIELTNNESIPFYFSKKTGIKDVGNNDEAVKVKIGTNQVNDRITSFYLKKEESLNRKGIYYRIPFTTELSVYISSNCFLKTTVCIPQLGNVAFLPSKIALRSNNITYTIDAKTGALLKFQANGEGLSSEETSKILDNISEIPDNKIANLENLIKLKELQMTLDSLNQQRP